MMMTKTNSIAPALMAISLLALGACNRNQPGPAKTPEPSPAPAEQVSIFRPEAEVVAVEAPLTQLEASVSFAKGGKDLSDAAKAQLAAIIQSEQMKSGGAVTLRGHSDSAGHDEANLRASGRRAEVVRAYLVANGIAEDRIKVIALGEMRPIAPNANLDGTPDEAGRAANRRVDVTIAVPGVPELPQNPAGDQPTPKPTSSTLVEVIARPD